MVERLWFQLVLELCFASSVTSFFGLMNQWQVLSETYSGWSLTEIKDLSPRERMNWIELAREQGKVEKNE